MKKFFTLLCGALLCVGANAETGYTLTLGDNATSLVDGQTYVLMFNEGKYFTCDNLSSGSTLHATTVEKIETTYSDDSYKKYLITFEANEDGTWNLKCGNGEYVPVLQQATAASTSATAGALTATGGVSTTNGGRWLLSFVDGTTTRYMNCYAASTESNPSPICAHTGTGGASQCYLYPATVTEVTTQTVTYNLIYDGSTIKSEAVEATAGSAASAFVPAAFTAPGAAVTLAYDVETIDASTTTVNVTATWAGPFKFSTSFDDATWYWANMGSNGNPYIYYDATLEYIPLKADLDAEDESMQWAFMGNPYEVVIYNKTAGSSLILGTGEPVDDGNNGGNTTASMKAAGSQLYESFCAVYVSATQAYFQNSEGYKLNDFGNYKKLAYWTQGFGVGSRFTFTEVDYATLLKSTYSTYFEEDNVDVYYGLTQEGYDALNDEYSSLSESCTADQYKEFSEKVAQYLKKPATGYYRLKNYQYNNYVGYNEYGAVASLGEKDVASVIYLDVQDDESFSIMIEDKYLQSPRSGQIPLGETAAYFTADPAQPGIIRIAGVTYEKYQYVNETTASGNYAIHGWSANGLNGNPGSYWYIYDATEAEVALTAVGSDYYATVATNFPYTVSVAKAYSVTLNEDKDEANLTEITATVPAMTGVVLSGAETATLTIDASNEAAAVETALEPNFEYLESTSDYVLSYDEENVVGFYKTSVALPANKAYLPESTVQSGVRGITFNFGETTGIATIENAAANGKIFDLQGRQLKQLQSGVQIVNGKKVVK